MINPVDLGRLVRGEFRKIETSSGHQLGDIALMDPIPERYNSFEQAVIGFFDMSANDIHRGNSRDMGGVYSEHARDMLGWHYETRAQIEAQIKEQYGIELLSDLELPLGIIKHDDFEEDPTIKELIKRLEKISRTEEDKINNAKDIEALKSNIMGERTRLVQEFYGKLTSFIDSLSLGSKEKEDLRLKGELGLGMADWLTRHVEQLNYQASTYHLYRRYKGGDYFHSDEGGPFQAQLMELLGIKDNDSEPLKYLWERGLVRVDDRICLSREIKQRFTAAQAEELESLVQKEPWLNDMYGKDINFRGGEMPRPYLLKILYKNFIVLQNVHLALEDYGPQTFEEKGDDMEAFAYLLGVVKGREDLMNEIGKIVDESISSYQRDLTPNNRKSVEEEIETIKLVLPKHFREVSGYGPFTRMSWLESLFRGRWEELDASGRDRSENYKDLLIYKELLGIFRNPEENIIDASRGIFKVFTIPNLMEGSYGLITVPNRFSN